MRIVIILRCRVWGGRPDGDKLFRNAKDRAVRSTCLRSLRRLKNSKSWNRLGLKHSRSGYLFQYSLRPLDGHSLLRLATGWKIRGSNSGGGRDFPHPSRPALGSTQPPVPCLFPGAKEAGLGVDNPPPSRGGFEELGELCIYSTSGPSWPVFSLGSELQCWLCFVY
jgi:hypothetical protein